MKDHFIERNFLGKHGTTLVDNGYQVVPIQPGKKAPGFHGWQKTQSSREKVKEWLSDGFEQAGVGILTRFTCAIDIDCRDDDAALYFERWCHKNIGPAPVRIGKAPKRILVYRTIEPFRKRQSNLYIDQFGDEQRIELLGDGQQFVAFHIHPETGKPYRWVDGRSPLTIPAKELVEIKNSQLEDLIDHFETYASTQPGWKLKREGRLNGQSTAKVDLDNPWIEDTQPIDIDPDELRTHVMVCTGAEDYDEWRNMGFALHHQFGGSDEGFELWNEWSETADNYDRDALETKWPTFAIEGKGRAPLTARYILRRAAECTEKQRVEIGLKLRSAFINAKTEAEWTKAAEECRRSEIGMMVRDSIVTLARKRYQDITNTDVSVWIVKKALAYQPKKKDRTPKWLDDWIYDVSDDHFFNLKLKFGTSKQGFNSLHDRQALTKKDILDGRTTPSAPASDLALNVHRIPVVVSRLYMPGHDDLFKEHGRMHANTYSEAEFPEIPKELNPRDRANLERIKRHVAHLLVKPTEQRMLIDWLSWVVQNPGQHANYAVLLQGVEGDGKTFFAEMMRAVMGVSNVNMANAATVINSQFSDWAYGSCLCCVEEIRIVGDFNSDKYATLNKIKPFITNQIVEVHPKGKKTFNAKNMTSYLLFTNFKDALPIDENSRRYLVLFSRWQSKDKLSEFNAENPDYYTDLYAAIVQSAGAIRGWLINHKQAPEFNAFGNAPDTEAKAIMVRMSKPGFIQVIDDLIAENREVGASRELLDVTELQDIFMTKGLDWPSPKSMGAMLERAGWESCGRIQLAPGVKHTFYSKERFSFTVTGKITAEGMQTIVDPTRVREFIAARRLFLDSISDL